MPDATQDAPQRVAIIGTGLSGLTTAYLLHNDEKKRYKVTLFEQAENLSFDGASVAVKNNHTGEVERVDLPMRASAGGYYSNLMKMYDYLGIPLHPIRFLFVFSEALTARRLDASQVTGKEEFDSTGDQIRSYFIHASNLHQTPPPRPKNRSLLEQVSEILFLIICYTWFSIACALWKPITQGPLGTKREGGETFEEYLERIRIPKRFGTQYLVPLMSSVSTCSHAEMLAFPASDVVNYKRLSHGRRHYAVCGGVSQVQTILSKGMGDVRLGARVLEVSSQRDDNGVLVRWTSAKDDSQATKGEVFNRVVLAVSPDVAGKIFQPLEGIADKIPVARVESSVITPVSKLGADGYEVVGDESVEGVAGCMHHGSTAAKAQTITFKTEFAGKKSRTEALHSMPSGVAVSTCPLAPSDIDSEHTLQRAKFTRTLRTPASRAAVEKIMGRAPASKIDSANEKSWTSGKDNIWLAGAWCWDGMVLLEGCVVSAMQIADDFGVSIPWRYC